jgi:ribonucleoside-diphosphate reductase alpha chain
LFLPADIDKWDLLMLHWKAWELGVKSLYYCRSKSIQRAEYAGEKQATQIEMSVNRTDYEECLSCQ